MSHAGFVQLGGSFICVVVRAVVLVFVVKIDVEVFLHPVVSRGNFGATGTLI